jgi:putative ABC transport system permease protein
MIQNFFKIAIRNLLRHPVFSLVNISGLALGIAASLAIAYYVAFELSYDDYHEQADSTYRVILNRHSSQGTQEAVYVPPVIANSLQEITGVENIVRFINLQYQNNSLIVDLPGDRRTLEEDQIFYADSTLGDVFDFEWIQGGSSGFNQPSQLLMSASVAQNLFGSQDALGQVITVAGNVGAHEFTVAGVFADLPPNSDFKFNILLSMSTVPLIEGDQTLTSSDYWGSSVYITLSNPAIQAEVSNQLVDLLFKAEGEDVSWTASLIPLREMHFKPYAMNAPGNRLYVTAMIIIGAIILILAWINYINLSTSRALERSREVGVRKVMGSQRSQLVTQFIIESAVLNFFAAALAFTFIQLAKPYLQTIANPMEVSDQQKIGFWILVLMVIVSGALLSGIYPAFILSSFKPANIFSGKFKTSISGLFVRKGLVIFQFMITIFLLIGALVVSRQINFMRSQELGISIKNRLIINSPPGPLSGNTEFFEAIDSFREEINSLSFVKAISGSSSVPGEVISWGDSNIKAVNDDSQELHTIALIATDMNYFSVYEMDLIAGRLYREGDNTFSRGDIVINEKAVEIFGFSNPEEAIGKKLQGGNMFPELTIVGVTANYHHTSLHNDFRPILYVLSSWVNYYAISMEIPEGTSSEIQLTALQSHLEEIQSVWTKFFPLAPFDYYFADQAFDLQYKQDREFGLLFGIFTALAFIIALIGLIGLVSYEVVQRTKEFGIRKVLGARTKNLINLLIGKYLIMVLIAGALAVPMGYWVLNGWLDNFAFRINVDLLILFIPFILVLLIAVLTVGIQIAASSGKNPIHSIRYE